MRTTITLEPDVVQLLKSAIRERDISFKKAINDALRIGLKEKTPAKKRFRQRTFSLGMKKDFPWEKVLSYAFALEDREVLKKMRQSK